MRIPKRLCSMPICNISTSRVFMCAAIKINSSCHANTDLEGGDQIRCGIHVEKLSDPKELNGVSDCTNRSLVLGVTTYFGSSTLKEKEAICDGQCAWRTIRVGGQGQPNANVTRLCTHRKISLHTTIMPDLIVVLGEFDQYTFVKKD